MSTPVALLVLLLAAALEAGGDALVRAGLYAPSLWRRAVLIALGAGVLLGVYVVFFFVVAQVIAWLGFHQKPTLPLVIGGALIVAGGLVISLWRP